MAAQKPRLIEVRYVYQTEPMGPNKEYAQFAVKAYRRGDALRVAFDLHGVDGDVVENVDVAVAEAIRAAAEMVRGRVKVQELHEQTE